MAAPYFQMDGWTDGRNRTIINFLVSCKDQVVFLKSLDASDKIKTAETLALILENVVMEVGAEKCGANHNRQCSSICGSE